MSARIDEEKKHQVEIRSEKLLVDDYRFESLEYHSRSRLSLLGILQSREPNPLEALIQKEDEQSHAYHDRLSRIEALERWVWDRQSAFNCPNVALYDAGGK